MRGLCALIRMLCCASATEWIDHKLARRPLTPHPLARPQSFDRSKVAAIWGALHQSLLGDADDMDSIACCTAFLAISIAEGPQPPSPRDVVFALQYWVCVRSGAAAAGFTDPSWASAVPRLVQMLQAARGQPPALETWSVLHYCTVRTAPSAAHLPTRLPPRRRSGAAQHSRPPRDQARPRQLIHVIKSCRRPSHLRFENVGHLLPFALRPRIINSGCACCRRYQPPVATLPARNPSHARQ